MEKNLGKSQTLVLERENAAVELRFGFQESWALFSAWLAGVISSIYGSFDIPESTMQHQHSVQAAAWRNQLHISKQFSGQLDKKLKCSAAMIGFLQKPLFLQLAGYCCASPKDLVAKIPMLGVCPQVSCLILQQKSGHQTVMCRL